MNVDYCFMKRVSSVLIFTTLLVSACSTVSEAPSEKVPVMAPAPLQAGVYEEPPEEKLQPTDPDVMYHVFSAEVMGAEGDLSGAASEYLEAALKSNDPEIAERATRVAVSAGEWQMVALASDRWAVLAPTSLDARKLAAGSRLREGDYVGAEFQLAHILEMMKSDQAHGWRIVTGLLVPANDPARANKVLDNLLADFDAGSNVDALFAQSQFAASTGDLEKAQQMIEDAIDRAPGRADLLAWSGRVAINMDDAELALSRYEQAWAASPGDRSIAMAYAELLKRNNDSSEGQAVLAQLPDTPDMRFARIVYSLDADDRETADLLYKGFFEDRYTGKSNAAFQAAQSAELLGYKRQAIDWYKQVEGEKSLQAAMRQAFLLAELGEVEEARNLVAVQRLQTDTGVRSQSFQVEAQILQDAGRRDEAMNILNKALAELPGDAALRYARALLAVGLGQLELAENDLRQLIADQPHNAAAINALGYTLADLTDRYDEAEALIRHAYELKPDDASIIDSMGWISYRRGRLAEAENYLREAWELMRNAEIAAHLGEVLWVSGQEEEAKIVWDLGVQLDHDNETLVKTMQRFGDPR